MLALAAAGVNLVVCGAVVATLLLLRTQAPADSTNTAATGTATPEATASTSSETTSTTTTSETTPDSRLQDFVPITGPGGMTTMIPASWPTKRAKRPGSMQADDPVNPRRWIRYGGAPPEGPDTFAVHARYEKKFSADKVNFDSIRLAPTVVRGMSAVDWEFEYDAPEGRRHVRSVYWVAQGHEYFVYASSLVPLWPDTQEILTIMLTESTP
ncbi:MAG TPA: hypothetical protein VNP92_14670 [Actinophytocola sp.]|nr:hypothetical protein [Actinophytocola sp.]